MQLRHTLAIGTVAALLAVSGCSSDSDAPETAADPTDEAQSLVVYSGRNEELVGPVVEQFSEETGIEVEVRYGDSAEMGAQLLEEGDDTPADVFYSQEVGAIGVLENAGLLTELPQETVELVGDRYRPATNNQWVGVTGRSRVLVYNPEMIEEAPEGVEDLVDETYAGQVGWAPTNASFQSFVTAFRVSEGEEAAKTWLEAMAENDTQAYESNTEVLEAVNNGDIAVGLINHYYWARTKPELGDDLVAELVFPSGDDPGGLVNATAVAITRTGEENPAALAFVDYLLSEAGQTYFVDETYEYPLVDGIAQPEGVPPLEDLQGPEIDLTDLASLEETQALLTEVGVLN